MKAICDIRLSTVGRRLHAMPHIKYCDLAAINEFRVVRLSDDISFQKCHR